MISLVAVTVVVMSAIVAGVLDYDVHWGRMMLAGAPLWLIWWMIYRVVVVGDDL